MPFTPGLRRRLRRSAGGLFRLAAWAKFGCRRKPCRPQAGPVCVVGFHGSVLGIGVAARAFSAALRSAGADVVDWDIGPLFDRPAFLEGSSSAHPPAEAGSVVIFLNSVELVQLVAMTGAAPFEGRFCVGSWAWELQAAPKSWRPGFRYVDEAWACSLFVANAIAAQAPKDFITRVLLHAVPPSHPPAQTPTDGKVTVLMAFDAGSGFERKNPIAAIRAFRLANVGGQASLICKAGGGDTAPDLMAALKAEIGQADDVALVTNHLSDEDMTALLQGADIVLSLHRSEGFGLLLAQAMAAGKPVVATGWSGNLDFMSDEDSVLVDYSLIPVNDPQGLYSVGVWADPDVDDAAAKLAALIADPEARRTIGKKAAAAIARKLDPLAIGRQARVWLGHDIDAGS